MHDTVSVLPDAAGPLTSSPWRPRRRRRRALAAARCCSCAAGAGSSQLILAAAEPCTTQWCWRVCSDVVAGWSGLMKPVKGGCQCDMVGAAEAQIAAPCLAARFLCNLTLTGTHRLHYDAAPSCAILSPAWRARWSACWAGTAQEAAIKHLASSWERLRARSCSRAARQRRLLPPCSAARCAAWATQTRAGRSRWGSTRPWSASSAGSWPSRRTARG